MKSNTIEVLRKNVSIDTDDGTKNETTLVFTTEKHSYDPVEVEVIYRKSLWQKVLDFFKKFK